MNNNHSKEELYIAKTLGNYLSELKVYKLNVEFWLSLGTKSLFSRILVRLFFK